MTWWTDAVGYEVYIRSFADGSGDGLGDFDGISQRLDHLAWLGVDVVWVTPFYPSPQADFGYDVADYTGVDPHYGDLAAFDRFVTRAKSLGLRVMIDIVPNHTSHQHPWFRAALEDPDGPYRDYYIFRPPRPDGSPPNNWVAHFGGPAWTLDPESGEYYCHLFLPEQPDLNWDNEAVREEFDRILSFWVDRGVDGFRIDVAHALGKHESFADNPQIRALPAQPTPAEAFGAYEHRHDLDQPSTREIFRRWKSQPWGERVLLLGEVYLTEAERSVAYLSDGGLDHALFFALNRRPWDPTAFAEEVRRWAEASTHGFGWTIASHDENRPVTRFGGGDLGRGRATTLWMALAFLPGLPFLYQGEELGLEDGRVAPEDVQDPLGMAAFAEGRDPCRTPMPWEPVPGEGFTTAERAWLRAAPRRPEETVSVQKAEPDSTLNNYRRLLSVRSRLVPETGTEVTWLTSQPAVVAYRRGRFAVIANLGDEPATVDPGSAWQVAFDTAGTNDTRGKGPTQVPAATGRVYLLA